MLICTPVLRCPALESGSLLSENCNLFAKNALFTSFCLAEIFCLSEYCINRVSLVFFKDCPRSRGQTLKSQNSRPLSYLLHVYLYTMSDHAIVCVCARVRVYDMMCVCVCVYVYIYIYIYKYIH